MRRKIMAMALTAVMALSLAACGSSAASTPASSSAPAESKAESTAESKAEEKTDDAVEPVTIKFQYWADTTEYADLMESIIAKFNAENGKGITVVGQQEAWDGGAYSENLFTAKMGGGDVDCATWKLTATPLFANNDLLLDLTDMVANWEGKSDIDDNIWSIMKSAVSDGGLYVMPWNIQVLYVYYRPSYFEMAGVEVPTTYEEFLNCIEKCTMDTDGDGKTDIYGYGMRGSKGGQEPWGSFIAGRGGSWDDLTTPEAIAGMQDFIDIYQKGYCPESAPNDAYAEIIGSFQQGLTAMTIQHSQTAKAMEEIFGDDVSAFAFPAGVGQWTSMGDTDTVIFADCENPEAAFEWITYLATGYGEEAWCLNTGNVPVSSTVAENDYFSENRFIQASLEGISYAGILPILDSTTEFISSAWPNTVAQALLGDITAEECMEKLQAALYG